MSKGRKPTARRNPMAQVVRKLGPKVRPSGKTYQRKAKHQNRRPQDGGSDVVTGPLQTGCTRRR